MEKKEFDEFKDQFFDDHKKIYEHFWNLRTNREKNKFFQLAKKILKLANAELLADATSAGCVITLPDGTNKISGLFHKEFDEREKNLKSVEIVINSIENLLKEPVKQKPQDPFEYKIAFHKSQEVLKLYVEMANEIGLIKEPKYHQFTADHYYMIDKDNKKSIISAKNLSSAAKSTSNETMKEIINKMLEFLNLKKTGYE